MMNKYFLKLSIHLFMCCSMLIGQKIVNMNGTYDLDGDNMLEFISLELNPKKDIFPKLVRYQTLRSSDNGYVLDYQKYQILLNIDISH